MTDCPEPVLAAFRTDCLRRQWAEIAVVVLLAVVPDVLHAVVSLVEPELEMQSFVISSVMLIQRSVTVSAVVLLLMWLGGEGWKHYGMKRWSWKADPLLVVVVLIVGLFASGMVYVAATTLTRQEDPGAAYFEPPDGKAEQLLLVLMSICNGAAEELVIWGFLFTRLSPLLRSGPRAVLVCAALFASYHLYQGPAAMLSIFTIGLVHGVLFWRVRRLWPLVIAHAIWDVLALWR